MRRFSSDPLGLLDRQRTLSESVISVGVLGRLGLLLLIVLGFSMAAQLLVGAPY
jgi:hypothetical protein